MQSYQGYLSETPAAPINHFPDAPIDFTTVKGVYKNCRGIWAAQWTDERGQRHTKYFNPKFFVNEQTARVEAYKFKIAIQREIEAKGGVQRKRPHTVRARQAAGRRAEYELLPTSGRRIRRSGGGGAGGSGGGVGGGGGSPTNSFSSIYCSDYTNASPELLAMLQSVNVAGLAGDPAVTEPILTWQSGIPSSSGGGGHHGHLRGFPQHIMWSPHRGGVDNLYRTGESVDGVQLSERMLDGFGTEIYCWPPPPPPPSHQSPVIHYDDHHMIPQDYWHPPPPPHHLYDQGAALHATHSSCLEDPTTMEAWWSKPSVKTTALPLYSEPLRKNFDHDNLPSVNSIAISCSRSAPPLPNASLKKTKLLNEHSPSSIAALLNRPSTTIEPMIETNVCNQMEETSPAPY